MLKARKYMLKGVRATKDLFKHYAIEHYISVFEVTHGKRIPSPLSYFVIH